MSKIHLFENHEYGLANSHRCADTGEQQSTSSPVPSGVEASWVLDSGVNRSSIDVDEGGDGVVGVLDEGKADAGGEKDHVELL